MAKARIKTFFEILRYLKIYKLHFSLSVVFTAISVALTLYVPILVGQAVDLAVGVNNVDVDGIIRILVKIGIAVIVTALLQWVINVLNNRMTYGMVKNIRHEAFVRIQKFPISYIDANRTGDVVSRVITDVDQFADGLLLGFTQFFNGIMTILGTLVFMVLINHWLALLVVLLTPLSFFVASFIAKRTYSMFKLQSEIRSEQTAFIDEMISGHKLVVAFNRERQVTEEFDGINERLGKASLRAIFFSSLVNPSTRFVNSTVYALVALVGAMLCINFPDMLTIGMLSSFLAYSTQYTKPFNEISGVITELQNSIASAQRVFELIEAPILQDVPTQSNVSFTGNVEFKNVCFYYTPEKPLIKNFNLTVNSGQRVAIVGPTGCGKTTLINLLMRFYDVNSGEILLDGINIRDISRQELRSSFGMVLQDTWLSAGTIKENIAFGNPDATDEQIITAAKAAHAHSFIRRLPNGYDTVIPEDGGSLSQGQKQLLCIARVILCLPQMLILDEATSSIDTRTEIRIQKAFTTMMQGRTSFIVAHRLSTILEADKILVMKDGNIIEQGTHQELIKNKGFYYELYNSQFAALNN